MDGMEMDSTESDGEAKVRLDIASKIWHRENKVPAPLRDDCPDTRLTKWAERETWTPDEAALLVYGYDPETYSANYQVPGLKGVTGLCGNAFSGDAAFYYTERLAKDWRRRVNASEKVVPAEFIDWCNKRRIDTRWLRSMQTAPLGPVNKVTPMQRAAAQDAEILAELRKLYDPLALPKYKPGKPGVKASIRRALGDSGLWGGSTVFNKAWERLTRNGDIAYAT